MTDIPYDGPGYDGCPWPIDPTCFADGWESLSEAQQAQGVALASSTLHRLTGGRVGGCPVKIRPCSAAACGRGGYDWMRSGIFRPGIDLNGAWVNNAGCGCGSPCGHSSDIALPRPVGRVDEVKVDGEVLDPDDYRIDNGYLLVWQGTGPAPWPATQELSLPDTEIGTFSITFLNSYAVDRMGAQAAATMAYEFAQACNEKTSANCRLPRNVVNVVRQGVTYDLAPGMFPNGFTGIDEVDVFITQWNPGALQQDSSVWSPGISSPRTNPIG